MYDLLPSRVRRKVLSIYGQLGNYSKRIDKLNRAPLFSQFTRENLRVPSFLTRESMWDFIGNRLPPSIDYLEFGVHEGHSILYWAECNKAPESRFFGFDTFSGLPEDWTPDYRKGHFDTSGHIPETTDKRVSFISGLFQDTVPEFLTT